MFNREKLANAAIEVALRKIKLKSNNNFKNSRNDRVLIGRQIRSNKVRCIDKNNDNLGVIDTFEALRLAEECSMDLIQVSKDAHGIPTCKILDYGKYKYDLSKKEKTAAKKQRESVSKVKEIKLRPSTDTNDLNIKISKAEQFLSAGHRVKITVVFKGRELSHKSLGFDTLNYFIDNLDGDIDVLNSPSMDGRILSALVSLKKAQIA